MAGLGKQFCKNFTLNSTASTKVNPLFFCLLQVTLDFSHGVKHNSGTNLAGNHIQPLLFLLGGILALE